MKQKIVPGGDSAFNNIQKIHNMISNMPRWITGIGGVAVLSCALSAQAQVEASQKNRTEHFEIVRFEVQGNTLLPSASVDQLLSPFAGKDRDFASVQMALEALKAAYRQKGYNVVNVILPEQELNQGIVKLQVIETKIGKIIVRGNQHFDDANIRNSMPTLQEGKTPNLADVSADLKIANENPAKKTTLQLQTGETDDQVNALLQVSDDRPWTASVSIDNTGDENTGHNRLSVLYQNADIGGVDHVLSLQYTTSFANPSEVSVYGIGYHVPLYAQGDSLDFFGSYSDVNSGTVTAGVFDLSVSGKGAAAGVRYNHNLLKVGDYDSKLIFGIDYKAFQNDISLSGAPLGSDVTVHPVSVTYTGNWALKADTVNFYASASRNIPGGDNGGNADFALARSGASENYSILRYGVSYLRILSADWQFRAALNGQITGDALVPGEQFGAGGANSVRGFEEREISNDEGRTTNLELYTPNLCNGGSQCRILSFYDTGYVSRNDALPGEITQESIGSLGLGLRLTSSSKFVAQADFAHVIDGTELSPKGSNRVHFRAVLTY